MARRPTKTRARATTMRAGAIVRTGLVPGADRPPTKGAPSAIPPIETTRAQNAVAPAPLTDRYPLIIGRSLTDRYLGNVFRLCLSGYRMQYVDLLDELLEHDGHLYSVIEKRVLSTANGRLAIKAFELPDDHPDRKLAQDAADMVQREVNRIRNLTQSIATLVWGIFYGVSAAEIMWTKDADGWHVDRLDFIHSRRLSYPDAQSWSLHIWDQGQVLGWNNPWGESATNSGYFGTCVAAWPGKFIVFAPQLRGDYPTREGVGRQSASWALFKRIGARGAMDYLERFAKGFMDGTYATQDDGKPREATPEDVAELKDALGAIGPGGTSYAAHADSTNIEPKGYEGAGTAKITYSEWMEFCDSQNSKIVLGGTLSTDHKGSGGLGGSGTAEVQERGEVDLEQFDATCLADAFDDSVVYWLVRMNMPEALRCVPKAFVNVDREPDAKTIIENTLNLTKAGARVDLEKVSSQTGLALIPQEADEQGRTKPRGSFLSDVVDPTTVHDDLKSDEQKQIEADGRDNDQKLAEAKAKQPIVAGVPGRPGAPAGKRGGKTLAQTEKKVARDAPTSATSATYRDGDNERQTILLSNRKDKRAAREVFDQLLEDYPAKSLGWVYSDDIEWEGPHLIELDEINFEDKAKWRASHEPNEPYQERIEGGRMKPIVATQPPKGKIDITDGHHRTLAYVALKRPALGYVAQVPQKTGPWTELHSMQKKGSSKGSWTVDDDDPPQSAPASYRSMSARAPLDGSRRVNAADLGLTKALPDAALVVLWDEDGRIVTVSRPEPGHEQSFPGGIVEDGETPEVAATREALEEVGVEATGLTKVAILRSPVDGRRVHIFVAASWTGTPDALEGGTTIDRLTPEQLFAQARLFRDSVRELMARDVLTHRTEAAAQ